MKRKTRAELLEAAGNYKANKWRQDWCLFVSDAFGVQLDEEQQAILRAVQHGQRISVASGTARGKDFVAACAAMCFLYLTPTFKKNASGSVELVGNTKIALTAPTDRQVKDIMMPEISRLYNRALARNVDLPGKLSSYSIRMNHEEWFLVGFKADDHNHEAWSGFHAVNTMFVVTEASGISDNVFNAIEGNLQGNSRILLVFNPNTSVGYAARSQKQERWHKFRLNSLTAPNVKEKRSVIAGQVDYEWVKDKVEQWCTPISESEVTEEQDDFEFEGQWYRPEDLFRVKVLGKFPKIGEDSLIPPQWLEAAHERWNAMNGKELYTDDVNVLGVDVAGMGRDSTCFVERKANWVKNISTHNSGGRADHMKIAGKIMDERRSNPYLFVSIDTIGEGAGVYARCAEQDKKQYLISCKYSEGAKTKRGEDLTDITGQYKFANMRAYLFWCVRDWLNPKNGNNAMLPPNSKLDEEATECKWFFRSDGKIMIEPKEDIKKRLGRSPDIMDALANTFYPIDQQTKRVDVSRIARMIGR